MKFSETDIPGCYEIKFPVFSDQRGRFVKTMSSSAFVERGLTSDFVETFHTISEANVLRGMHFQLPPSDHAKLVYCLAGRILDVCLDIRQGSPTYGKYWATEISGDQNNGVYMPTGIGHGFYVLESPALTVYQVTTEHNSALDTGIAWDSFGMKWPTSSPMISARDRKWLRLEDFKTPFRFEVPRIMQAPVKQ